MFKANKLIKLITTVIKLFILFLIIISQTVRPWEYHPVEDNVIIKTEVTIRHIVLKIIETFNIKTKTASILDRYFTIHNNLLAPSLRNADDWTEIEKHTKVNMPGDMVDIVSEVINEITQYPKEANKPIYEDEMIKSIIEFLQEVELYNSIYRDDIIIETHLQNKLIMKNTSSDEFYNEELEESFENEIDTNEYWKPSNDSLDIRRIFGSTTTNVNKFPFMAAIIIFGQFHCAGSIISSDLILTAASGVQLAYNNRMFRENPAFLAVRVGSSFHALGGDLIAVLQIYFHPSYNPKTLASNICVLRLIRHIRFKTRNKSEKRVRKIEFDKNDSSIPNNTPEVLLLGWGARNAANKLSLEGSLRYARLYVYDPRDCQDIYSREFVTIQNFCAGFVSKGGGACNQDVGDPGVIDGVLHGIVSFGAPVCGAPDTPTVFTKVGFYADWIETIMEERVPQGQQPMTTSTRYYIPLEDMIAYTQKTQAIREGKGIGDLFPVIIRPGLKIPTEITIEESTVTTEEPTSPTQEEENDDNFYAGRTAITTVIVNQEEKSSELEDSVTKRQRKKTTSAEIATSKTTTKSYDYDFFNPDYNDKKENNKKTSNTAATHNTFHKSSLPSYDYNEDATKPSISHPQAKKIVSEFGAYDFPTESTTNKNNIHIKKNKNKNKKTKATTTKKYEVHSHKTTKKSHKRHTTTKTKKSKSKKHNKNKPKKNHLLDKGKKTKENHHKKLLHDIHTQTDLYDLNISEDNEPVPSYDYLGKYLPNQEDVTPFQHQFATEKKQSHNNGKIDYYDATAKQDNLNDVYKGMEYEQDVYDQLYKDQNVPKHEYGAPINNHEIMSQKKKQNYVTPDREFINAIKNKLKGSMPSYKTTTRRNTNLHNVYNNVKQSEKYQLYDDKDYKELNLTEYGHKPDYYDAGPYRTEKNEYNYHHFDEYHNSNQKPKPMKAVPSKFNNFGEQEIVLHPKKPDNDMPRNLDKLGSHELKQMFLEQLSKHGNGNTFGQSQVQKFIDKSDYSAKQESPNQETGIYDLIKSAISQIAKK